MSFFDVSLQSSFMTKRSLNSRKARERKVIEMRTIVVYFFIINAVVSTVVSWEDIPVDIGILDRIMPSISHNPNADLTTPEIIRKDGYPAEAHFILTEDGYLLTLHRIPGRKNSPPVLLQHGLLGSSADWVISGRNKALAYILADQGYDVWLGNYRGNIYSKAHIYVPVSDSNFWNFSWHEMGIYDLSAMILYITNLKQGNVSYVGFSMGTTAFYVMASRRPDIASRVEIMFSLAPVAYMSNLKSPVRYLAPMARDLQIIAHGMGFDEFLPQNTLVKDFTKHLCKLGNFERMECANLIFILCGYDKVQLDPELVPVIFGHTPAGSSIKTLVHYAQEIVSGKFRQFDYGTQENLRLYNSPEPPPYDVSKITVPIALYYADNDLMANMTDVHQLSRELKSSIDVYQVPFSGFNHLDFLWARKVPELVYSRLLSTLKARHNKTYYY